MSEDCHESNTLPSKPVKQYDCTCHCGGSMFYRHLHAPECALSVHGEEAPQSKEQQAYATLEAECRWAMEFIRRQATTPEGAATRANAWLAANPKNDEGRVMRSLQDQ